MALVGLAAPWAFVDRDTPEGLLGVEVNLLSMLNLVPGAEAGAILTGTIGLSLVLAIAILVLAGGILSLAHPGAGASALAGAALFAIVINDPRSLGATAAFVDYSYGFWLALFGGAVALAGLAILEPTAPPAPASSPSANPPASEGTPRASGEDPAHATEAAGSPAADVSPGWLAGILGEINVMQRSIRDQEDFLFQLDQGLLDGRVDNATYHEIRRARREHLGAIREEVEGLRRRLQESSPSHLPAPDRIPD